MMEEEGAGGGGGAAVTRLTLQVWLLRFLVVFLAALLILDLRESPKAQVKAMLELDAEKFRELTKGVLDEVAERLTAETFTDFAEHVIDELIDVGAVGSPVDLDDPLLVRFRTIALSGSVDGRAARNVVSQLLYLDALEPGRPIDFYIRTQGGWASDAHAICDAMQKVRSPVNTWALGSCESAGAILLAGGTGVRRAFPDTIISIHLNEEEGDEPYSDEFVARRRGEAFWKRRAKLPDRCYPMVGEVFFNLSASEALEFGVIDEIHKGR
jgi:ATP-dependent Clp protease protease subunit